MINIKTVQFVGTIKLVSSVGCDHLVLFIIFLKTIKFSKLFILFKVHHIPTTLLND